MARGGRRSTRGRARRAVAPAAEAPTVDGERTNGASSSTPLRRQSRGDRGPLVRDVSAGGVVFRRSPETNEIGVALVGRLRPKRWALPKGTPVLGETLEETAIREVGEETGLLVRILKPLEQIQYWFVWGGVRHFKTVHFYLMEMVGGDIADHDAEYDVVEWFSLGEALRLLSYPNEARVVEKAREELTAGT